MFVRSAINLFSGILSKCGVEKHWDNAVITAGEMIAKNLYLKIECFSRTDSHYRLRSGWSVL